MHHKIHVWQNHRIMLLVPRSSQIFIQRWLAVRRNQLFCLLLLPIIESLYSTLITYQVSYKAYMILPQILELAEQFKENVTPAINGTPLGRHHSSSIVLQEMVQISCWSSHSIKISCSGTYKPTPTINFTFEVHLLSRDEQLQKCLNWMSEWGCSHEKEALETYKSTMQRDHANFKISRCGFFISVDEPHLGASPDSLVSCTCHGSGVVEVKCPYCARDMALKWCSWQQRRPFLPWAIAGWKPSLEVNTFLLLCQLQLHVTKYSSCDFVVWTKQTIHIECMHRNDKLLENVYTMYQLQNFFSELYFAWATIKVVLSQQ